jgi:very-short-patch-repair endonuclease
MYDKYRDEYLEAMEIKTIHFSNDQITNNLQDVIKKISEHLFSPPA